MSDKPTIDQMNEAIAIFDGWELVEREVELSDFTSTNIMCFVTDDCRRYHPDLKYHESWDWLIPVVEKIATLSPDDVVHMEFCKTYVRCHLWNMDDGRTRVFDESGNPGILTVHKAVYQFIKWYNKQKQ
jgi:hypothetical protein